MIKLGHLFELHQQGYILPWGPRVDIACHCHHRLDVTSRKYQKTPKTICTPELSREALADMRSWLCLDWYLGLKSQSPEPHHDGKGLGECPELALVRAEYPCLSVEATVTAASSLITLARHSLVLSCKRLDFASPGSSSWDRRENSL